MQLNIYIIILEKQNINKIKQDQGYFKISITLKKKI